MATDKNEEVVPVYPGTCSAPSHLQTRGQLVTQGIFVDSGARPDAQLQLDHATVPLYSRRSYAYAAATYLEIAHALWKTTSGEDREPTATELIDRFKRLADN